MALSKSQIKKIDKYNKYFVIVPYGALEFYLTDYFISYYTKDSNNKYLETFVLNIEEIKNIINNQPAKGYFTIYEPKFDYKDRIDIGLAIESCARAFENKRLFECVYMKDPNGNIKLNKYNW